jgi:hypothetical protein
VLVALGALFEFDRMFGSVVPTSTRVAAPEA